MVVRGAKYFGLVLLLSSLPMGFALAAGDGETAGGAAGAGSSGGVGSGVGAIGTNSAAVEGARLPAELEVAHPLARSAAERPVR
jgi:hypothetical protein